MTEDTEDDAEVMPTRKPAFKVRSYVDPVQLKKDLAFSLADLSSAMMAQASLFAHYGTQAALASRQVNDLEMLIEVTEGKLYRAFRDEALKAKDKDKADKPTEAALKSRVQSDGRLVALQRSLNEALQIESLAKTAVEAFRHRRDMLVQQGLISREEIKGEVSISRRREIEEASEEQRKRVMERLRANQA